MKWSHKIFIQLKLTNRTETMLIAVLLLIVAIVSTLWKRRWLYQLSWQLSGPIGYPIIGNFSPFMKPSGKSFNCELIELDPKFFYFTILQFYNNIDVLPYFDWISSTYRSPCRLWIGPQLTLFVSDAANAEIILKSKDCLNKPDFFYKITRDSLNVDGVFTLIGLFYLGRSLI